MAYSNKPIVEVIARSQLFTTATIERVFDFEHYSKEEWSSDTYNL